MIITLLVFLVEIVLSVGLLIWNAAFLGFVGEAHRSDRQTSLGLALAIAANLIALLPLLFTLLQMYRRWAAGKSQAPVGQFLPFVAILVCGLVCAGLFILYKKYGYQ